MKKILLPTDFSDNAWSAAVYALKLYAEETCTFYFLHSIVAKLSTSNLTNKLLEIMRNNAMKELVELKDMAETSNANPNHSFEIILSVYDLQSAIKTAAKSHQIDLVVIGKKGLTKAEELFFGGNAVETIEKMRLCPILTVPEDFDYVVPKQIAFPTDYNRFYDGKDLTPLKDLARLHNSKIRIMHIKVESHLNAVQEYNLTALKEYLEDFEHSFHWMPDYTKKTEEINEFIRDLKIDILAMVNYKHSFIEYLLKEPVIKNIEKHPPIPFLVIPG